ncbi:ABC transporter permease [Aureimonas sp. AU20]|uniref:ABC transporter permease n=1 Tax=Aureimonas sp. AU20 TaxID=1349819 RepID=UPI0007849C00|nr:ABC transporter permease [Aureimonas sp. AU20]
MALTDAPVFVSTGHSDRKARMRECVADFSKGLGMRELWLFLGWRDVRKHYQRSVLGPFWLTLSMGLMVLGLGILYSQIFGQAIHDYLPFLAIGFIIWGLISGLIIGACDVYSGAAASVRQVRMPLSIYVFQFVWRQFITFAHNFIIYIVVAIFFGLSPGLNVLMFLPALVLVVLNGFFVTMILAPLCARFRDIPMIVQSVVQIVFFMTPILWDPKLVPQRAVFLQANPFYHFIEIIRAPLLGRVASLENWTICLGLTAVLGFLAFHFFARYRPRIAYWA